MTRRSRCMGYQNAAKTIRNAPEATKRENRHESTHQRLLRLKAKEKTMEEQEVGDHK